jgi:hypothetical protein
LVDPVRCHEMGETYIVNEVDRNAYQIFVLKTEEKVQLVRITHVYSRIILREVLWRKYFLFSFHYMLGI